MTNELLQHLSEPVVFSFLIFVRISIIVQFAPSFSSKSIPMRFRFVIALVITAVLMPLLIDENALNITSSSPLILSVAAEIVSGLIVGFSFYVMLVSLQIAGSIASQSMSLAQIFGTAVSEPMPALGHLMVFGGLALAAVHGYHVEFVKALLQTYQLFPIGTLPDGNATINWSMEAVQSGFNFAFRLAAPFVIASFIYNIAIGVINRAMPQLMVAFVGAPAVTGGALIILALVLPLMLSVWWHRFQIALEFPVGVVR